MLHRQSLRLRSYDYVGAGGYFVTLCTWQRECLFGDVVDGVMKLNEYAVMTRDCWLAIPQHFPHVALDEFVIMPNHVHGVLIIKDVAPLVGAQHAAPLQGKSIRRTGATPNNVTPGSLGAVIRSFKSVATKRINALRGDRRCPVWQRNYYEHIIRSDNDLHAIRDYISNNPMKWLLDENYPVGVQHAAPQMATP